MKRSTMVSGITLVVLVVVLAAMAVYGFRAATAPVEASGSGDPAECSPDELQVQREISRDDVQVSVFNAGRSSGAAGRTLDRFEALGFRVGEAGNAPAGLRVPRALVLTTEPDDTAAQLVARTLGPRVRVRVTDQDLGPGVDVVVGDRLRNLDPDAPASLELAEPIEQCIEVD